MDERGAFDRIMITFSTVEPEDELRAYAWHVDFTDHDKSVFPRGRGEFHEFIMAGMAWAATDDRGDFLGLAYAAQEIDRWEVGGLAVTIEARRIGVGLHLAYATLGHLLFEENPLADDPPRPYRVIVHVLKSNEKPRAIIEQILRFRLSRSVRYPGSWLRGLETDADGYVHGDEFEICVPDTLNVLAEWAETWDGKLGKGERAYIDLREGITLQRWSDAFRQMAVDARPTPRGEGEESDAAPPASEPKPRSD